jgi:hypothetical protein
MSAKSGSESIRDADVSAAFSAPLAWASQFWASQSWASQYWIDAGQRTLLFWDILRRRGNGYFEQIEKLAPHTLDYEAELVLDGRTFERPVNYALARIVPPENVRIDPALRPFVVVDPRAGHGPGIGGFKADSEIGVIMKAGHPCYFVGFLPDPMPGQTIGDVARAEAKFLEKVAALHPQSKDKPCVIGNCQAGWAVMLLAAIRPELFGPIIVAGSPLSYWAGVRGSNPMRYTGGLLGGSWLAALAGDLGQGIFDGASLVQNFENLNPANTYWTKQYDLYKKIDTEAPRYLGFEKWWGGHVTLNAEEIQFIVDELFVGNNLAAGRITLPDGTAIDLRNIQSPIVVFCSKGDNITPPQQALGWILDLYDSVDEIRSYGQTIVYTIHETVGHLGVFVSGSVSRKEYDEFSSNIDLIDTLPPGLYEATFTPKDQAEAGTDLIGGAWLMRCEARTLEDIRALGRADDERLFAAAARISDVNLALYRSLVQPWVRAAMTPAMAQWMRDMHPLRLQYSMFADKNPFMAPIAAMAKQASERRAPVSPENPFVRAQEMASTQIEKGLDLWRDFRDRCAEQTFTAIYGSPIVQAMAGLGPDEKTFRKAPKSAQHQELVRTRIEDLMSRLNEGGMVAAVVRSVLYIGATRGGVDERGFEMIRRIRRDRGEGALPIGEFKKFVREQFLTLLLDQKAAIAAIPAMLPNDNTARKEGMAMMRQVLGAAADLSGETKARFDEIARLFESEPAERSAPERVNSPQLKAS